MNTNEVEGAKMVAMMGQPVMMCAWALRAKEQVKMTSLLLKRVREDSVTQHADT